MKMPDKPVELVPVALGAKYCECGGMMAGKPNSGLLMSKPPQVQLQCPFCGSEENVVAPYNVDIQFMKKVGFENDNQGNNTRVYASLC